MSYIELLAPKEDKQCHNVESDSYYQKPLLYLSAPFSSGGCFYQRGKGSLLRGGSTVHIAENINIDVS